MCAAIDHVNPNGSFTWPYRSPQNWSASGIFTSQPAAVACANVASAFGTYTCSTIGQKPSAMGGVPNSGKWSLSMRRESPMLTSACITLPPGPSIRETSRAPNAFLRKSM